VSEVISHPHERYDLPIVRQRGVERGECVGDAAPLFDRPVSRVSSVDDVPDERSYYAKSLFSEIGNRESGIGTAGRREMGDGRRRTLGILLYTR
jgi:hypothetical protein